jgi:hypothetical protein
LIGLFGAEQLLSRFHERQHEYSSKDDVAFRKADVAMQR